jgi:hypothetical protein
MKVKWICTIDGKKYELGNEEENYIVGEIATTFVMAVKEDWFGVFDEDEDLRALINPANVVRLGIG